MSEREFQDQVVELARLYGWRVAHFRPANTGRGWRTPMQGDPGFPDLVLAKEGRVIFAELKSSKGRLSPAQHEWLTALLGEDFIGNPAYVGGWDAVRVFEWRPEDFEEIADLLSAGRAHAQ